MATFTLRVTAENDLIEIGLQGRQQWGEALMQRYITNLDQAFHAPPNMPQIGRACPEVKPGYRRFQQGSHIIFYRLTEVGDVDIVRILHERMDHENHLD
jgi:toxin ParE1/3/4